MPYHPAPDEVGWPQFQVQPQFCFGEPAPDPSPRGDAVMSSHSTPGWTSLGRRHNITLYIQVGSPWGDAIMSSLTTLSWTVCLSRSTGTILPSRRGCCSAGRSAGCLHTAPWWGSASEAQNTSASTPHGLFLKGSSVYKTRQTDFCSEADDFHSNVICTTTVKGNTLQETFNYVKLNLS